MKATVNASEHADMIAHILEHKRKKINEALSNGDQWRFFIKHADGSTALIVISPPETLPAEMEGWNAQQVPYESRWAAMMKKNSVKGYDVVGDSTLKGYEEALNSRRGKGSKRRGIS